MYAVIVGVAVVYGTAAFAVAMWIEQGGLRRRRAAARARAKLAGRDPSAAKTSRIYRAVRLRVGRRSA
jgi:hypothetical protein